jgi:hypothetical protein
MNDSGFDAPPPPPPPGEPGGGDTLPARGLGDILTAAFDIYKRNAAQLLLIVAIIVVPLSVLGFLISHFALSAEKTVTTAGQSVESRSFFIFLMAALVAAAISIIIAAILQAAMMRAAAQATVGDPVDVGESYRWGLRRFGSVLLVSILVGVLVAIGFILLIIPGIILLVFFAVSIPAVVVEGRRGTDAMRRSWNLVRRHFWHVLGVIVVAFIITGLVSGLLGAIGGSNSVLQLIFRTIGQIIVAPFSALVTVLLYLDLRARSESLTASTLRQELGSVR